MELIYKQAPQVTLATNVFVNIATVLQFDDTPLISVVREQDLTFTTEIPVYHEDGTYLAKIRGTRIFATENGKKAGVGVRSLAKTTVCTMGNRTVFEIHHQSGDAFKTYAELYTPEGFFVKTADTPLMSLLGSRGEALRVGGIVLSHCMFNGGRIGILLRSDGSTAIGVV